MPALPHPFPHLDALERRYDGPIPPHDPAGIGRPVAMQRARLFGRLAAETRHEAALQRARLTAAGAQRDPRLHDIACSLAQYRCAGVSWAD